MIKNIKRLHKKVENKKQFNKEVADYFHKNAGHVTNRWFCGDWNIPEQYQADIVSMLQIQIRLQIERLQKVLK